ncbi:hypothetical protein [Pseudoduganella sp. OTU4001]|uniref:hypothetical protein n=1 Tax=Pseudoduganella sp. OTU4001 TaxID=3043854 RepID=UPI00313B13D6
MKITNLNVDLPTELADFLFEQAAREHISPGKLLSRAIRLEEFVVKHERANHKLLIETPGPKFLLVTKR